jgi:hypothetical protein
MDQQATFLFQTDDFTQVEAALAIGQHTKGDAVFVRLFYTEGMGDVLRPDKKQYVVRGYPKHAV